MKNLKKYLGIIGLVLAVMMLTSCKTVIGGIELKTSYVVFAILAAIVWAITAFLALLASKSIFAILSLLVAAFPFFWTPTQKLSLILFGIGIIMTVFFFFYTNGHLDVEAEAAKQKNFADNKANETTKAQERYTETLPKVKRYLDSVGFELPPDENVFFMQIDPNTGNWKYEVTYDLNVNAWVKNTSFSSLHNDPNYKPDDACYYRCKYKAGKNTKKSPSANGILLTADGKAYIGAIQGDKTFWWHTEDGKGIDNSVQPEIHTVLAIGNVTKQLLCGLHVKVPDTEKVPHNDICLNEFYTNTPEEITKDYYWCSDFPKSVKRVFVLPSDEYEKKNTVTLGAAFNECSNLRLFYMGFDKCEHEKFLCKDGTYKVFADDSHAEFISPSSDSAAFFNAEKNCKNWEFKVGKTIKDAVSVNELKKAEKEAAEAKAKAEAEAKAKAEAEAKAKQLAEIQPTLQKLESELEAKKAEAASLASDAQGIMKKAKLNKEIKELEPQIETLKAEVEKLNK